MPRLESFNIKIKTGDTGRSDLPGFAFNGIPCEFEDIQGDCASGAEMEGCFAPRSFTHSFVLQGPQDGKWDISETEITYLVSGQEPYTVKFGPVTLDENSDMNLWHEPPAEEFDV